MGSFPMWVSFVWLFPRSSKMVTSYAPSIASCSIPNSAGSILFPSESEKYIEEMIFSCRTISWYSTAFQPSCPSGDLMQQRSFPPTRKSILQTGEVKPFGPHHCIMYFGSVHAFQTNSRGASKILVTTIRSISLTVFFVISGRLFLHLIYNCIQFVEALFPEAAIVKRPVADFFYRLWPKRAHTLSSTLRLDHNPRPHQVGNMFRNHLLRKCKRFRQSMHRGWPMGESFDHRSPGWIRQSGKRCTQFIHNHMVVDCLSMSSVNFAIPDLCLLIPKLREKARLVCPRFL